MKETVLTLRLDPQLAQQLAEAAHQAGLSPSEVVQQALRRHLAITEFESLRRQVMPLAEAQGYLTDEDIFRDVS